MKKLWPRMDKNLKIRKMGPKKWWTPSPSLRGDPQGKTTDRKIKEKKEDR